MAACRWGNLEKVTVQDFQCQVGNRNLKDAETQTEILSYHHLQTRCPRPFWQLRNSLTSFAIKLWTCVRELSFRTWENPLFRYNTNKRSYRGHEIATTLPRQHGAADGEQGGLKIILEESSIPRISFLHYIKNANHSIENMTTNDELETCDEQLLFTTSTSLENLVNSNLSNLQHCAGDCDCEKKNWIRILFGETKHS